MKIRYTVSALLILLTGCSSLSGKEGAAPVKLDDFKQSAAFTVRWHKNIGDVGYAVDYSNSPIGPPGDIRWRMNRDLGDMGNSTLQPALMGDAIYVANSKGKILRLKRDNGEQQWRIDSGITITGGVGAGDGLVLVGGEKGEVAAYTEDGKLRWQSKVSSEVLGAPQIADGTVVVRSVDGRIAGLSAADGKRQWLYEHIMPALIVRSTAGVAIQQGTIYAGFAGGKLVAISLASGNLKWEATLSEPRGSTELERISDITSTPQVDDEAVCAVSFQGRVGCFGPSQGNLLWSHDLSSDKGLEIQGKFLYVSDAQGDVLALDKNSGSSVWKNDQLNAHHTTAPVVLRDYLVAADNRGYLYAMKRDDGSLVARLGTDGSAIPASPVVLNDGLLVQTYDGGLYSVALH